MRNTYTPTTPGSSPKKSFLTSDLYFTRQGIDGLNGVYKVNWHLWEPCQFLMKVNRRAKCATSNAQGLDNGDSVQNDAFGLEHTKNGKIGRAINRKLSQMNSYDAARVSSNNIHTFLVNVSPISQYHTLLCPSVNLCLPQVVTEDSLKLAIEVKFLAQDRRHLEWIPNLFDTFTNKTSELTDYVKSKGNAISNFYVEKVKKRIVSYLGVKNSRSLQPIDEDEPTRVKRRFDEYITTSQANSLELFDSIAPATVKYECTDNDPSIHMTTPQLIALHGYNSESHTVVTDDGYILTVHRIPYSKYALNTSSPKKTVLLHHGLLGSSADWVIPGPGKGLAYVLSDAGYDVWMANVRGNTYSRAHISYSIDSFAFWNFTFHEVSQHDLPAVIDHVMKTKGWDVKINYIGHSMGTTVLFALLSTKTQYNHVLRAGYALAPVAFMTEVKSPIRLLAKYADNIVYLLKLLGQNEFLPQNAVLRWLSKHACEINHYEEAICENSMFVLCGHDEKQFNKTLMPIILGHVPAGASTRTLVHYAQEIRNAGRFQQFDYGAAGNMRQYGSLVPPEYPLHNITLPIALFGSENDWLASDVDVTNLYTKLANPIEHYIVPLKEFNHIDFLWAIDAPKLVYAKLLQLLEEGVEKIQKEGRKNINIEEIQPGNMKVWSDPFDRKKTQSE
ncbi:hypothetical protein MSG28_009246 [Choristoneura fumiferana]|uniref:Uncharacterized protein n=1 Tax=Choristoneura fumiferana TaxID=7141 RepID=A0ACC0KXA8_CHOFU|nr:hypothetical protein MSG28_009246 [Choristoneura fumiferana]